MMTYKITHKYYGRFFGWWTRIEDEMSNKQVAYFITFTLRGAKKQTHKRIKNYEEYTSKTLEYNL